MILLSVLFLCFIHVTLLVPSYGYVHAIKRLRSKPEILLLCAYSLSMVFLATLATLGYVLRIGSVLLAIVGWLGILGGTSLFVKNKLYQDLSRMRFPLACFAIMSLLSLVFISLSYPTKFSYIPDPTSMPNRNYNVLNVKVLNVVKTQANDNYVPYRQAQFFINRSDPARDSFINEWGVSFFQRTPLMGAVTAGYYTLLQEKPPIGYLWSADSPDPHKTYSEFQILAQALNTLFIIPTYFLVMKLFNKKTAQITSLFLLCSPFFLYNTVFTWPKSLVAFFVLAMWLLLLQRRLAYTVIAGVMGGLAYLTHDLAVFYVLGLALMLLYQRRFRDMFIVGGFGALFALPWLLVSSILYNQPSTFVLYPFSLHGLPQPNQKAEIIREFLRTSPLEIVSIRFDTLFYLLSPYDLIYTSAQSWLTRFWATSIFSIPGSLGLGLVIPIIMGAYRRLVKFPFWIFVATPILLATGIVGWRGSRAIASLHFAEAIIVVLTALGIASLIQLRRTIWFWLVLSMHLLSLVFVILYSYNFTNYGWLLIPQNLLGLLTIIAIVVVAIFAMQRILRGKAVPWLTSY